MAATTTLRMMASPSRANRSLAKLCHASEYRGLISPIGSIVTGSDASMRPCMSRLPLLAVPRSWIQSKIDDIDGEIHEHEPDRDDEHRSLDHGNVSRKDPLVKCVTHSRPGEDVLGKDRSSK